MWKVGEILVILATLLILAGVYDTWLKERHLAKVTTFVDIIGEEWESE